MNIILKSCFFVQDFFFVQNLQFIIFTKYFLNSMNIIKYLKQPFPKAENKWKTIFLISILISLFLIIFQPFGINSIEGNAKIIFLFGYGVITFITLVIDLIIIEKIFPKFFLEKNWSVWKEFVWLFFIVFSIGLGNAFYSAIIFNHSIPDLRFIISFQVITLVVALIPITILVITKQKYLLKKNISAAKELNKSLIKNKIDPHKNLVIQFFADNNKDFIEFDIDDFLFIETSGNYLDLYLHKNNEIIRKTFRSTLKRSLTFFADAHEIIQCHRAFIVNTSKVINAKGNSQGLRLRLENYDTEIPVSRSFVSNVKSKIS